MHPRPVFADPSGRRRRLMRRAGLALAIALGVCLLAVVVAVAGGPQAPFTHWAAPKAAAGGGSGAGATSQSGGARTRTPSPSVQVSPHPSGSAPSPAGSPVPTNKAGRTPTGLIKSPNPHKSSHGP